MGTIRLGRCKRLFFDTSSAIRCLGISSSTFYEYVRLLNLRPKKIRRRRGKYWSWGQLRDIVDVLAPPIEDYRHSLAERVEIFRNKKNAK